MYKTVIKVKKSKNQKTKKYQFKIDLQSLNCDVML